MRKRSLGGLIPAFVLAALPAVSSAGVFVGVSVNIAPPALPVYVQPPCPEPGYIWTPGYWGWNDGGYYWVPGTWVLPPQVGLLWTPGWWGWESGAYLWHAGYWGPHVGFYGGVNYGFGYDGAGFVGGYWRGRVFYYNRAVAHVGPAFAHNVYYHPVVYHAGYEHVSFNGGPGGVRARPSHAQMLAGHEHHLAFTSPQQRQQRMAFADHSLRADYNHGRPPVAATARVAAFHGNGAFGAHAATAHHAPPMRSDRPAWAGGQDHGFRSAQREPNHSDRPQAHFARPQPQHFQAHPQNTHEASHFEAHGSRPSARPEARPQPRFHQSFRPEQRGPAARGPAPHPQQRGGNERPHHPPDNRGGGHGRQ